MIGTPQPTIRWKSALCALVALGLAHLGSAPGAVAQPAPDPPIEPKPDDPEPLPSPDEAPDAPEPTKPERKPLITFDPSEPRIDEEMLDAIAKAEGDDLTHDVLADALTPLPDGLQPRQVADKAVSTSPSVAVASARIREASARLDQAFAAYFPKLTLGASYTRVNEVDLSLDIPGVPSTGPSFPQALNQWALTASLEVPISDYILRLTQGYAAASNDVEAQQLATEAEEILVRAQAKAAYFNWVRAQGRAVVSGMAVALSRRNLEDAKISFSAGTISGADVARLESSVAQSRHLLTSALAVERLVAMQLRRIMHTKLDTPITLGVDVLAEPPPKQKRTLVELIELSRKHRLDLQALEKQESSLEELESTTRAGYAPRLSAFANGLYANPNPRVFTAGAEWNFTWEVGARLTWTVNDTFQTLGAVSEAEARTEQVRQQLRALEDGVILSVTQAYSDIDIARSAIEAAKIREEASKTSLLARRKLFQGGRATATDIVDAEKVLIDARLQRVDAHVDLLVARANLEQAVGTRLY